MALYVIGDLHLSLAAPKPMDVFGGAWTGYMDKLNSGISGISSEDTIILLGDISWAQSLDDAYDDFAWINRIPGKKIIIKGNHDYWWSTASKFSQFCMDNAFSDIHILNNNHYEYDGWAICGTRGWNYNEDHHDEHDDKILNRELMRLESSLKSAGDKRKIVFLHYPPCYKGYECTQIIALMKKYQVYRCYYAHLHGASHSIATEGMWDGVEYKLVSADKLNFLPHKVI